MKADLRIAFAAAMVLGGLSTGAAAAPIDLSSGSAGFVSTPGSGGFSDSFTFSLLSTTTVNVLLSSVVGGSQDVDFTSITIKGPGGEFSATTFTGDPYESWVIRGASLIPGGYTLTATGINSAAAGTYAGSIALSGSSDAPRTGGGGPLDLSSGSTGFVHTPGEGAFADSYTFSLVTPRAINVLLSSVVGGDQDVDFTSLILKGPSGVFSAATYTPDPFENWVLSTPVLGAGNYTLTASGNNSAAVGTYAGSIAISDSGPTSPNTVPEPGSSALLLAGLGAALATRRKSRADNSGQCRNHLDPKAASSAASFAAPAKNG